MIAAKAKDPTGVAQARDTLAETWTRLGSVYRSDESETLRALRELVIESGRSYFDTNITNHHHFFFEENGALVDIPGESLALASMPTPPEGARISRIDVIVRVTRGK